MIELPRACVRADEIAEHADFFSFGTNDLTQTTLGFSRDDAEGKFLTHYLEDGVLEENPFETLDQSGVGDLMRIAVERARGAKAASSSDLRRARRRPASGGVLPRSGSTTCRARRTASAAPQAALAESGVTAAVAGGWPMTASVFERRVVGGRPARCVLGAGRVSRLGPATSRASRSPATHCLFPEPRYRVTVSFTGDVCGDPFDNPWVFEATRTGG